MRNDTNQRHGRGIAAFLWQPLEDLASRIRSSAFIGTTIPSSTGAVFLSYVREDGAAARRIADALRSHAIEVWFDESVPWSGLNVYEMKRHPAFAPLRGDQPVSLRHGPSIQPPNP